MLLECQSKKETLNKEGYQDLYGTSGIAKPHFQQECMNRSVMSFIFPVHPNSVIFCITI